MNRTIEYSDGTPDQDETLSLRDLRSFVAVVRAGGVTRAARELGYAQATLSTHLSALENAIGVPLIERERRGAPLTEAGRTVLARAQLLLRDAAALYGAARSAAGRATARVAACEPVASHRLPPLLAAFSRQHPEIDIELRVAGHVTGPALVEAGNVAFAIAPKPAVASRAGVSLSFTPLYEEPMLVVIPTRHRLAQAKAVDLADLRGESLLVGNDACAYRALIVGALRESDVEVALRARFGDGPTLAYGVAAGLGIAVLPAGFFIGSMPATGTVALPLRRPRIAIGIGLVQARRRGTETEAVRVLRRAIVDGLRPTTHAKARR